MTGHTGACRDRGIHRVDTLTDQSGNALGDLFAEFLKSPVNSVAGNGIQDGFTIFGWCEIFTCAAVEFSCMQLTETLGFGGKSPDVIIAHYKNGSLCSEHCRHINDVFFEIFIQRTKTHFVTVHIDGAGPLFLIFVHPGPVPQYGLDQDAQLDLCPGKLFFERAVAFHHLKRLFHGGEALRVERQTVEDSIVFCFFNIIYHICCQFLFPARRVGDDVEKMKIPF